MLYHCSVNTTTTSLKEHKEYSFKDDLYISSDLSFGSFLEELSKNGNYIPIQFHINHKNILEEIKQNNYYFCKQTEYGNIDDIVTTSELTVNAIGTQSINDNNYFCKQWNKIKHQ